MAVNESNISDKSTENPRIIVEKLPSESRLSELGVKSWPKWACPPGRYKLRYDEQETCYLVKGKVRAYFKKDDDDDNGDYVEFGAGDLVIIPKGLACTWDVSLSVDKFYKFQSSSSSTSSSS
ncbi:uncharacterized protein LOC141591863 [Silene latifolia]|uniref:uncharacterized protein LOC141591863 n=1 Tax=Silene latifolia TaxID=37657 RepID=UPI003D777A19